MSSEHMQRFVAAAEKLHFARAATSVGVSRATLVASVKSLEADLGYPLFDYAAETTTLTDAGVALLARARTDRAEVVARVAPPAGGKAKASKGKGRAPAVKGAPRVGKRRQSR